MMVKMDARWFGMSFLVLREELHCFVTQMWPWIHGSVEDSKALRKCPPNSAGGHLHVFENSTNNTFVTMKTTRQLAKMNDHIIHEGVEEWFQGNEVSSLVGNVLARSRSNHLNIALLPRTASLV
jgi:hypothetical protein